MISTNQQSIFVDMLGLCIDGVRVILILHLLSFPGLFAASSFLKTLIPCLESGSSFCGLKKLCFGIHTSELQWSYLRVSCVTNHDGDVAEQDWEPRVGKNFPFVSNFVPSTRCAFCRPPA